MTLRFYCEQMGLSILYRRSNGGWACEFPGFVLRDERVRASAVGPTKKAARIALAALIAGHVLQEVARPSTLHWAPSELSP